MSIEPRHRFTEVGMTGFVKGFGCRRVASE